MSAPKRGRLPSAVITWDLLLTEYISWLTGIGRSPQTIKLRTWQLKLASREIGGHPNAVTEDDLTTWLGCYADLSLETRRSYRASVCGFFEWAYKMGRITTNPAADLPKLPVATAAARPADDYAWRQALAVADLRVTLMLRLAGEVGLRRAEVARLHTRDLIESDAGPQLVVHGKGSKKRVVPLSEGLAELIRRGAAGHTPGATERGWLFPDGFNGHITPAWVGTLVSAVLPEGVTMHTLRHRFATRAYRGSRNIRAVQQLLGHASVATTERYTAVNDDEMRAAMMHALS
ncbi:integrase [Mycolicibacterium porcinum]|nr:integrase [Mycolicibacterium porcinum]